MKQKKAIFFIGLKHHFKKLLPISHLLKAEGFEILFITSRNVPSLGESNAECFELFLLNNNIDYRHLYDYRTQETIATYQRRLIQLKFDRFEKDSDALLEICLFIDRYNVNLAVEDALENYILFQELIEKEAPDILIGLHEANFWVKLMAQAADIKHIPVLTFQEGYYSVTERLKQKYSVMADYSMVALWGEDAKEAILEQSPASASRLTIVGDAEYDELFSEQVDIKSKVEYLDIGYEIKDSEKVVIILLPNPYERYKEAIPLDDIIKFVSTIANTHLLIKWHPRESFETIKPYIQLEKQYSIKNIVEGDVKSILPSVDLCLVLDSSAGLDALIYQKPLIEINIGNIPFGRSYAQDEVALLISRIDQLPLVNDVLTGRRETCLENKRSAYLEKIFYRLDGRTKNRVLELIRKLISKDVLNK